MMIYRKKIMTLYDELSELRLHYLAQNLDSFVSQAESAKSSPRELLQRMTELELVERSRRSTDRRLREARLGRFQPIADYDWTWPKEIDRGAVESLFTPEFLESRKNVILAGAQGLGKTMIARNLGHYAVMCGYTSLFTTASALAMDLGAQDSKLGMQRRLRLYESKDFLIIDEIGYLSFDCRAADFIFEIVNRRYEKSAICISTNLAFKDWNQVFPGAPCVTAMIDRLMHHAKIIKIAGDSHRIRDTKSNKDK
jgi:DNA replication protein DnaC